MDVGLPLWAQKTIESITVYMLNINCKFENLLLLFYILKHIGQSILQLLTCQLLLINTSRLLHHRLCGHLFRGNILSK